MKLSVILYAAPLLLISSALAAPVANESPKLKVRGDEFKSIIKRSIANLELAARDWPEGFDPDEDVSNKNYLKVKRDIDSLFE